MFRNISYFWASLANTASASLVHPLHKPLCVVSAVEVAWSWVRVVWSWVVFGVPYGRKFDTTDKQSPSHRCYYILIEQGDLHHQLCSSLIIIGMQREGKNGERGTYDAWNNHPQIEFGGVDPLLDLRRAVQTHIKFALCEQYGLIRAVTRHLEQENFLKSMPTLISRANFWSITHEHHHPGGVLHA